MPAPTSPSARLSGGKASSASRTGRRSPTKRRSCTCSTLAPCTTGTTSSRPRSSRSAWFGQADAVPPCKSPALPLRDNLWRAIGLREASLTRAGEAPRTHPDDLEGRLGRRRRLGRGGSDRLGGRPLAGLGLGARRDGPG